MAKRTRNNWRRNDNGLLLPEHPGALVPRGVGRLPATVREWGGGCFAGCCEDVQPPCNCDCENCAPVNGEYVKNAPCCWTVTIRGMKPADPVVCEDCDCINYTYYLSQDAGENANPCLWRGRACNMCTTGDEITLEVIENAGVHKIVVTLGDYVWSREYESPPDCCNISKHVLTPESGSDDCDATQSVCEISSGRIPWSPDAECATPCCNNCSDQLPKRLVVHMSAVENADPAVCTDCTCLNRHWCLQRSCGCTWKGSIYSVSHCIGGNVYVRLVYEGGEYILRATYGLSVWEKNYGDTKPDCAAFDEEELTLVNGMTACDVTAATMTVTAGTDDCVFQLSECDDCTCGIVPDAFLVSITGVANGGCSGCDSINGSFVFPRTDNPCQFNIPYPSTLATLDCPNGPHPSEWRSMGVSITHGFSPWHGPAGYMVSLGMNSCGAVIANPPWYHCNPNCYNDNGQFISGAPHLQKVGFHLYSTSKFSCKDFENTALPEPIIEESDCCDIEQPPFHIRKACPNAFCDFTQVEVKITALYL